jgi:hypothetical protein
LLLLLACARVVSAQAVRGDGIAAIVGDGASGGAETILHSDVELVARLSIAARTGDPFATPSLPAPLLSAALEQIIGEVLIAREADRVQVARAAREDRDRELDRIVRSLGGEEGSARFLGRAGVTDDELRRLAHRRALVAAFLRANLSGTELVTDADVERLHASGDHPFVGRPLEEVREPLRAVLLRQRLAVAVERWVRVLRARTEVRVLSPYARSGAGDGRPVGEVYDPPARG